MGTTFETITNNACPVPTVHPEFGATIGPVADVFGRVRRRVKEAVNS